MSLDSKLTPEAVKRWVSSAKDQLREAGVIVLLKDEELLEYSPGQYCSGYFEDDPAEDRAVFAVSVGRPWQEWFPIFIHEFCHFEQWRDRREWWDGLKIDGQEGLELAIQAWAGKIEATPTQIIHWCRTSAVAEYDCERRVIETIKKHGLPVDCRRYAKKANSYITYYYAMPELGGWCNGDRPYEVNAIMDLMPDHLDLQDHEYWELATKVMDLYRKHCLHKKHETTASQITE